MSRMSFLALGASLSLLAAPALAASSTADIKGAAGATIGLASFQDGPAGVVIHLEARGLTPGWHAVHLHEKGDCSDAAFTAAGGHINHAPKTPHGLLNPGGPDMGDLPNIYAAADGSVFAELYSPFVSVAGAGGRPGLVDADGSALVIHANKDDYLTQPIGGAGPRVACGVVKAAAHTVE